METGIETATDGIQDIVPEKLCLETVTTKNGSNDDDEDEIGVVNPKPRRRRIVYAKEFLLECFRHPACSRKPAFFFPNLECELATARLKGTPFTTVYVTPRKKDESRRKFPEDNISLRPHSGNFSSGCAPNLSPAHFPQNQFSRFQFHHEEPSKNLYDRGFSRNNYRFNSNVRQDLNERNRVDRDRDRERELRDRERDRERDRDSRENRSNRSQMQNPSRRQNAILWGPEAENQPEWTRRRTSYSEKDGRTRTSSYNRDRGSQGYHREYEEELEPEWFSGGPKSQHETIELHGFDDDGRRDTSSAREKGGSYDQGESGGDIEATNGSSTNISIKEEEVRSDEPNDMVLSIEKILKIDHIPGILPNELFEDVEPAGSSRFSQFFQRNSSAPAPNPNEEIQTRPEPRLDKSGGEGGLLQALFGPKTDSSVNPLESKSDVVKTMETELRQILLRNNDKEDVAEQPKEPPKQEDLNAFKKLLEDLVIKSNKTVQQKLDVPAQDKANGPAVTGPPPGLHSMPFNPFSLGIVQPRHHQPQNTVSPPMTVNVNPMMMHPLSRLVEQQQQQHEQAIAAQNQKRSGTPIQFHQSFTPTAVMRKMTADQQTKTGASVMNENVSTYNGLPRQPVPQGAPAFPPNNVNVNMNAPQPNPLSSIMSAMANQSQHIPPLQPPPQPQQLPQQPPHPGHLHPHPHQPHLPPGGYHPSRVQFPVMVGPPNPAQFPPFMIYGPPVPQRK